MTNIQTLIENLGGIEKIGSVHPDFSPTSKEVLAKFLDITHPAFADYIDFMQCYGGQTDFIEMYELTPYSDLPVYCYSDDFIKKHKVRVGLNLPWAGGEIGVFFGQSDGIDPENSFSHNLDRLSGRIPDGVLPIG